ncbi:DoxX family protein, partial [Streptomyces sp. NPDC127110]|uniref:DoxX family protein n=1 Tax=Streptomyces sp. NPDC127110 TaxID=3345362 RepID=UPI00363649F8
MTAAQITLAALLTLVFLPLGAAKIAAVPFMRQAAAHLGMSPGLYRVVGTLEAAGALGLVLGLGGAPPPPCRPPAAGRGGLSGGGGGARRPRPAPARGRA